MELIRNKKKEATKKTEIPEKQIGLEIITKEKIKKAVKKEHVDIKVDLKAIQEKQTLKEDILKFKKEKEKFVGVVLGGLCLIEAAATALGVPVPLTDIPLADTGITAHTYFLALMIYITAAGLIAMVVVHIYNRIMLQKIKEIGPFGEKRADKPDS